MADIQKKDDPKEKNIHLDPKQITPEQDSSKDENNSESHTTLEEYSESYSGPVMPAAQADYWEHVQKGAANRLLTMGEKEQKHRHWTIARAQVFAFILGLVGIGGGIYLVSIDKDITGLVTFLSSLAALIYAFIGKQKSSSGDNIIEELPEEEE